MTHECSSECCLHRQIILFLFEQQGSKNIVLGSLGMGVFRDNVEGGSRGYGENIRLEMLLDFERVLSSNFIQYRWREILCVVSTIGPRPTGQ
ncbi:uncharacterized protein HD556DRAFT_1249909 [Suillus plorans]|uniref:Uncharacterized protein n=1 Tax=Suillus plorans TaxID=116603 RepID=A0A9P7AAH6_9AGAM|nr:uncharacterized protein HD556DRAFT_1249909 [Suillus plorans]KAG1785422.1 hypothetical protein HD556DRAFT_1249909 [Suillus plorans]